MQWVHAAEIRMALHNYALDHGGKFPNALTELSLDEVPPEARRFHDPQTKQEEDWVYYGGYSEGQLPRTIILASPRVVAKHKRIVVYSDCSAAIIEEDVFVGWMSGRLNGK